MDLGLVLFVIFIISLFYDQPYDKHVKRFVTHIINKFRKSKPKYMLGNTDNSEDSCFEENQTDSDIQNDSILETYKPDLSTTIIVESDFIYQNETTGYFKLTSYQFSIYSRLKNIQLTYPNAKGEIEKDINDFDIDPNLNPNESKAFDAVLDMVNNILKHVQQDTDENTINVLPVEHHSNLFTRMCLGGLYAILIGQEITARHKIFYSFTKIVNKNQKHIITQSQVLLEKSHPECMSVDSEAPETNNDFLQITSLYELELHYRCGEYRKPYIHEVIFEFGVSNVEKHIQEIQSQLLIEKNTIKSVNLLKLQQMRDRMEKYIN